MILNHQNQMRPRPTPNREGVSTSVFIALLSGTFFMQVDIAKNDLLTLRREVYDRLDQLKRTPAATSDDPQFRNAVEPQIEVLSKFVRKLNRACVVAFGHDCHADAYPLS